MIGSFTEPGKESPEEHAFTEVGEAITESNSDALPREVPTTSMEYKEQDSVQTNIPEEDTTNRRTLKAPSIALQNKKTLADVIASYEDGLDSLRTKLGPQLTNTLLSMEDLTIAERENNSDHDARNVPVKELKEEAPDGERQEKTEEEESDKEQDQELTKAPDKTPVVGNERESLQIKELRAPDIMATSGKTLEEVIEDYEERINEELNNLEEEVCLLKEKIGNDLFFTLLGHPNTAGENSSAEELTDQVYTGTTNPESFTGDDLKPSLYYKMKVKL
ncbi:hypothetical protein OS493_035906 [Desmophyllum pertusum]|uniref:Uncharacterized protein n=1 Tax=Desmophyllum pertusum TaxID=174260 RepID=A0A9X0CUN7_9CNID|nr:hypothetical protein OS493_035906 [Desmophyllum pertusum]